MFKVARRQGATSIELGAQSYRLELREIGFNEAFQQRTETAGLTPNSYESTRLLHEAPG
jgi:hypothetical protein